MIKKVMKILQISFVLIIAVSIFTCCNNNVTNIKQEFNSLPDSIFPKHILETQDFMISAKNDTSIKCKLGTEIIFDKNSFSFLDGTLCYDNIILEVTECYNPSDIIFNNLSTQTEKGLLSTNGMINIQATCKGNKLVISKGKTFKIIFPKNNEYDTLMKLYKGIRNDNYISWFDKPIDFLKNVDKDQSVFNNITDDITAKPKFQSDLERYLFETSDLCWLNCDKKLEGIGNTIYTLNIDTEYIPNLRIIFPKLKAAAYPRLENNDFVFYNIPIGEPAIMIGFYKINDKIFSYKKEFNIAQNGSDRAIFKQTSLNELTESIENIRWQ